MLFTSVRVRPWRARLSRSSSGRVTARAPSSPFATVMGETTVWLSVPLGPLTVTKGPSIETSTPEGTTTGILPMRDMTVLLLRSRLPDVGEDFPTHALLVGLAVGQETLARGDDGHAEAAEDLRQTGALRVHAQPGLADP